MTGLIAFKGLKQKLVNSIVISCVFVVPLVDCCNITSFNIYSLRFKNENGIGITSLEWDPSGLGSEQGNQLAFADREGYVGVFEGVYPSNRSGQGPAGGGQEADPLAEDSLLMEVRTEPYLEEVGRHHVHYTVR